MHDLGCFYYDRKDGKDSAVGRTVYRVYRRRKKKSIFSKLGKEGRD